MNARHLPPIRSAFMILIASVLLTAGHASAASVQPKTHLTAFQYFDAIVGNLEVEAASALLSPDARLHTPEGVFRGADGASNFGAKLEGSFSDLSFDTRSVETAGEYVVIEFLMTGVHTGAYHGTEPGCSGIVVPGMAVLQAGDSGFTEQWVSYDSQTVLDQIYVFGLFNPEGRPGCDGSQVVPERIVPPGAPACTSATKCEMPY